MLSSPLFKGCLKRLNAFMDYRGVATAFKPHQTLRQLLVSPKDESLDEEKAGVVYRYPCKGFDKVYIGETKIMLGDCIKKHCAPTVSNQSALAEHCKITGHNAGVRECQSPV